MKSITNQINNVKEARRICKNFLAEQKIDTNQISLGLPELDERYKVWRASILFSFQRIGEIVILASTGIVDVSKSTKLPVILARIEEIGVDIKEKKKTSKTYQISPLKNTIIHGNSEEKLYTLPENCVDLVFTSPPYYNAKPEYSDYVSYESYLEHIRLVIRACHRVLNEGRFFVMNVSPILVKRINRSSSSQRLAVPFDVHRLFIEEGFDFIDDIIWEKPEASCPGRNRGFFRNRKPLQYKPNSVTEYVLVYRKHTDKLLDWNVKSYPFQEVVESSRILEKYETSNIWKIIPAHKKNHPAVFPERLAELVIKYYSFKTDVVLDPYAGSGTVGKIASKLERRFLLCEAKDEYFHNLKEECKIWDTNTDIKE